MIINVQIINVQFVCLFLFASLDIEGGLNADVHLAITVVISYNN